MMRANYFLAACITFATFYAGGSLYAQSTPPFVSDQIVGGTGGKFENVDLANGGLNLSIQLYNIHGRGKDDFAVLNYTSKNWYTIANSTGKYWEFSAPWRVDDGHTTHGHQSSAIIDYCTYFNGIKNVQMPISASFNQTQNFPDGSSKTFPVLETFYQHCNTPPPLVFYATTHANDASGTEYSAGVIYPDGTKLTADSNGNSESGTLDSAGRTLPTVTTGSGGALVTYTFLNGAQITLHYVSVPVSSAFANPSNAHNLTGSMPNMLSEIDLPNGTSWQFQYAQNAYGQLTKIILPTGGYIRYTYAVQSNFAMDWSGLIPSGLEDSLVLTGRFVSADGVTENGETYTYSVVTNAGKVSQRIVTNLKASGDQEIHMFQDLTGLYQNFQETDSQYYKGTTSNIRETLNTWTCDSPPGIAFTTPPSGPGPGQLPGSAGISSFGNCKLTKKTTMLFDGPSALTKTVQYQYDASLTDTYPSSGYPNITNTQYTTTFGNITQTLESDWGSGGTPGTPTTPGMAGTAGPLLRETDVTYLTTNPQNGNIDYRGPTIHIVDRPILNVVKDGSGNVLSQTSRQYDGSSLIDTSGTPAPQHDYTNYSKTNLSRGDLTQTSRWLSSTNTWLSTNNAYDDLGNLRSQTDPNGNTTSFSYADNFSDGVNRSSQAYLTQITRPTTNGVNHVSSKGYYYPTALLYQDKDENQLVTTYVYDNMDRLTSETFPDGGSLTRSYQDVAPLSVTTTTKINSALNRASVAMLDGLGRTTQTQLTSDQQGTVLADTVYDSLGRLYSISNPYRTKTEATYGVTTHFYDPLDRTCVVVPPDGTLPTGGCPSTQPTNDIFTTYAGNTTTVTDQAGKSRKSVTDGIGRLTQVFEDPASANYETDYTYDTLGNLLSVNQKGGDPNSANWRTRTFAYDSLSRLLCAANPEVQIVTCPNPDNGSYTNGTVRYSYDNDSNVLTKKSPKPNQTSNSVTVTATFGYDALNRITSKSFDNGDPTINSAYDGVVPTTWPSACPPGTFSFGTAIGRRTAMCDGAGMELWGYSITSGTGWLTTDQRTTNSVTKTTSYQNNFGGMLATLTYPTGRVLTYTPDGASRMSEARDVPNSINYVTGSCANGSDNAGVCYLAPGSPSSLLNGSSLVSTFYYNSRLQPCRISVKSSGTAPTSCTDTTNTGNALDFNYNFNLGASDNGNVIKITNNRDTARSINYGYDNLNRMAYAYTDGNLWGETYQIDSWGNLNKIQAYTGKPQPENLNQLAGPSNQFTGMSYDAAGNLLNDGASNYVFDGENRITTGAGVTYTYDGDGRRVKKSNGTVYWYGTGSDPLDETDLSGNLVNEYIFFAGKRIARRDSSNNVFYYLADHLGTSRVMFQSGQSSPCYDADFYPYGVERTPVVNSCSQNYKFTGKERDTESSLDYFGARHDASYLGRFMSRDLGTFHLDNPQSLNRYAYALNDPLRFVDPDGKDPLDSTTILRIAKYDDEVNNLILRWSQAARQGRSMPGMPKDLIKDTNDPSFGYRIGFSDSAVDAYGRGLEDAAETQINLEITGKVLEWMRDPKTTVEDLKGALISFEGISAGHDIPHPLDFFVKDWINKALWVLGAASPQQALIDSLTKLIEQEIKRREEEEKKKRKEHEKCEILPDGGCGRAAVPTPVS